MLRQFVWVLGFCLFSIRQERYNVMSKISYLFFLLLYRKITNDHRVFIRSTNLRIWICYTSRENVVNMTAPNTHHLEILAGTLNSRLIVLLEGSSLEGLARAFRSVPDGNDDVVIIMRLILPPLWELLQGRKCCHDLQPPSHLKTGFLLSFKSVKENQL